MLSAVRLKLTNKHIQARKNSLTFYVRKINCIYPSFKFLVMNIKCVTLQYRMTHFGGAFIVYAWIRVAAAGLIKFCFEIHVQDTTCKYLITSNKIHITLLEEFNVTFHISISGSMEFKGGTMMLYFYSKFVTIALNEIKILNL